MKKQKESRSIVLPILNLGAIGEWVVTSRPTRFTPRERNTAPIVDEAGWAPGPGLTVMEKRKSLAPTWIQTPERPARTQSLYRWRCPGKLLPNSFRFTIPQSVFLMFDLNIIWHTRSAVKLTANHACINRSNYTPTHAWIKDPGSIPGQYMWHISWTKRQWGRFLSDYFGFSVSIIPPMHDAHSSTTDATQS